MATMIRITSGLINITDMGLTDEDDQLRYVIASKPVLDGRPYTEFKHKGLTNITLRGGFWPVDDISRKEWNKLISYLDNAEDPYVTLVDVTPTAQGGSRQAIIGTYYVVNPVLEESDIVNGISGIQRWRIPLIEHPRGQAISPTPTGDDSAGNTGDLPPGVPENIDI